MRLSKDNNITGENNEVTYVFDVSNSLSGYTDNVLNGNIKESLIHKKEAEC